RRGVPLAGVNDLGDSLVPEQKELEAAEGCIDVPAGKRRHGRGEVEIQYLEIALGEPVCFQHPVDAELQVRTLEERHALAFKILNRLDGRVIGSGDVDVSANAACHEKLGLDAARLSDDRG